MENAITRKKSSSIVESTVSRKKSTGNTIIFIILCALVVVFLYPIMFIVINSFKGKFFISQNPFALPTAETFAGLTNYINGLDKFNVSANFTIGNITIWKGTIIENTNK